jgi:hypothetical protein
MEHVVFYPSAEGSPAFRRVPSLEDAVNFVEHLRNSEGTTDFSVHALAEVPLSFRAYYHVEVPEGADGAAEAPAAQAAEEPAAEEPAPVDEVEPVVEPEPVEEPAAEAEPVEQPVAEASVEEPAAETESAEEPVAEAPVAEAEPVAEPVDEPVAEAPVEESVDAVPVETPADDDDRSAEWVAEAPVQEPAIEFAAPEPVAAVHSGPFEVAPPVTPNAETVNPDVVPVPTNRRSMGFFAR